MAGTRIRENVKKCPKCDTEMDEGMLGGAPYWGKGTKFYQLRRKKCIVIAWHCPKCGCIMLYEKGK